MAEQKKPRVEIINRRAKFEYHFLDTFEAGIVLTGTEIKSIRAGNVNLNDAYCRFKNGELFVESMYIKEYKFATHFNHEARRPRKLLLRRTELRKLEKRVKERGFTIVPFRLFISERGLAKLEIALAQGKKTFDKRESIKEKDQKRDLARMKKMRY
ncbi:MAG: SsrA-binding protein SmpB [Bacteroidetes bacterium]|nr:MAG: SsrA-binding protein SmpB [Bacteroidota bacterium]